MARLLSVRYAAPRVSPKGLQREDPGGFCTAFVKTMFAGKLAILASRKGPKVRKHVRNFCSKPPQGAEEPRKT